MEQRKTITPAKKRMRRKKIQNIVRRIVQVIFFIFLCTLLEYLSQNGD